MNSRLRVIDFGRATPLRSQTLWHAVAHGVSAGAPPTLSFVRPSAPYVGIGYHRHLDEVDEKYCRSEGLPIYRRMVGGGPVYLDGDQLFFQICLPAKAVSPSRFVALRELLSPAVAAFRAAGIEASLDDNHEICVAGRKVCGHGAGQIEDAVVVCGNLIERFDHDRATRILRLPDKIMRAETLRLMRRHVSPTSADPDTFRRAMIDAYASALGLHATAGELTGYERAKLGRLDELFLSARWLTGSPPPIRQGIRQVKVRAGVWVFAAERADSRVVATVVNGTVERAWLRAHALPSGRTVAAERALLGVSLSAVPHALAGFGPAGRQLAAAFALADGKRL